MTVERVKAVCSERTGGDRRVEAVCACAWRNYMLFHGRFTENDERRSALYRFINELYDNRGYDFELLHVAAVYYLKKLDELHEDREARSAADELWRESNRAKP